MGSCCCDPFTNAVKLKEALLKHGFSIYQASLFVFSLRLELALG